MIEKSESTIEDFLGDKEERVKWDFYQESKIFRWKTKDLDKPTFQYVKSSQDLVINKLDKISGILEKQNKFAESSQKLTEVKHEEKISELEGIINILYNELEKKSNARFGQILSILGISLSIIFYFVVGNVGGVLISDYHFIMMIIFFSATYMLSHFVKSYKDGKIDR